MTTLLKFNSGNKKLGSYITTFSLPAGHSCKFAKDCRSCCIKNPRKRHDIGDRRKWIIQDGPHVKFRCFAAIDEALRPAVRNGRWHNFNLLKECSKTVDQMANLIQSSLPKSKYVRMHISGDFFSQNYFDAWLLVAKRNPHVLFYGYTKALPYWIRRLKSIPKNVRLTASKGGTHDHLIEKYNLRYCVVVKSPEEAKKLGLKIDHDDSLAYSKGPSYSLLLHGTQPKETDYAKAWTNLKKRGMGGYGNQKQGYIKNGLLPKN